MNLSDGEKLILVMLRDLYGALNVKGEIDPEFVMSAISSANTWGLDWEYPGVLGGGDEPPEELVHETLNVLEMWSTIEASWGRLSNADKDRVTTDAEPFGNDPKFPGFDGNNEDHYGVALFLIGDLKRFSEFEGRDLNSHAPSIDSYLRMWGIYEGFRSANPLSADELIEVLQARIHPTNR